MYFNKLHIKSSSLCFSAILLNTVCGGCVTSFCQYINIFARVTALWCSQRKEHDLYGVFSEKSLCGSLEEHHSQILCLSDRKHKISDS